MQEADHAVFDLTAYTPATLHAGAEHRIAQIMAAAANTDAGVCRTSQMVCVGFALTAHAGRTAWDREAMDQVCRAVDRAVTRIHPALDPLQYLGPSSPHFWCATAHDPVLVVTLHVQPTVLGEVVSTPHRIHGDAVVDVAQLATQLPLLPASRRCGLDVAHPCRTPSASDDAVHKDALHTRRDVHRRARWLAERFVNEAGWAGDGTSTPRVASVLEAAQRCGPTPRRFVHADGCGIEFDGVVVAHTARYAYVAVHTGAEGSWYAVGRLPLLDCMTSSAGRRRSKCEMDVCAAASFDIEHLDEATWHDTSTPVVRLAVDARWHVRVRAYRVFCHFTQNALSLWFDDLYLVSSPTAVGADRVCCLDDCVDLVRRSCARYLARAERWHTRRRSATEPGWGEPTERLYAALTDTRSVWFGKSRGAARTTAVVPVVHTLHDVAALHESAVVEFKYQLEDDSSMSVERVRHTIAAMASTHGGVIVVGVADNGVVVGHAPGHVQTRLRQSGFCPAMVKDAVTVRELPAHRAEMAPNWWKASAKTLAGDDKAGRVISVIAVRPGRAPFYAASRRTLPYMRTCASTVPMPITVLTARIEAALLDTQPASWGAAKRKRARCDR